jgi:hypothetical protein
MADYIPISGIIIEGITFVVVTFVVIMLYIKYLERRKEAALTLAAAFTFWNLGIAALFATKLTQYLVILIQYGGVTPTADFSYSNLGINIAYGLSAISNVFIVLFVSQIFSQAPFFRRTKKLLPIVYSLLNGITIGMVISTIIDNPINPQYPIPQTIYHLVMTFISFGLLAGFTANARRNAVLRWEKAGFSFIIWSAILGFMLYLCFAVDIVWDTFPIRADPENGFTLFYFIAYVCGMLMCIMAYLGYTMPQTIRSYYKTK